MKHLIIQIILAIGLLISFKSNADASKIMWVLCKINYGGKGTYSTVGRYVRHDNTHVYVTYQGNMLVEGRNFSQAIIKRVPKTHCRPL